MPAALPVAIPLISTAVSMGTSVLQTSAANRAAKKAQEDIDNYQRQDIVNPNLGLQVSTLGADRQREDINRSIATMANQAAMGGSRSILGIAPNLLNAQMQQEQQIAGTLDEQEARRQAAVAQGEGIAMQMTEARENADLAGLGNQLNVSRQERANGINNMIQTGFGAANVALEMNKQGLFGGGKTPDPLSNQGIYRQNGVGRNMTNLPGASVEYNPIAFMNPLYQQQTQWLNPMNINPFTPKL